MFLYCLLNWDAFHFKNSHLEFFSTLHVSHSDVCWSNIIIHNLKNNKWCRVFSLTWSASLLIYWNKRKFLHKKRVQLSQDWIETPTWPPFHCFGTPKWPPWRHVKTLYRKEFNSHRTGLKHQHGRRFIVLELQNGRRDVMWKRSIELGPVVRRPISA